LGANESVFGASPFAVTAMQEAAARGQWYGDPTAFELRSALAARIGGGLDNYVVGAGIDGLLLHLCRAYLAPGDAVVTTQGSYPTFEYAVVQTGARLERVPYRDYAPDLEGLAERANETRARLVYLANPDNPSGALSSASDIANLRGLLPAGCLLVLDEAYAEFVGEVAAPDFADSFVVRVRTFSKAYGMAGLRVGYVIGHPDTLAPLNLTRAHFEVSSVSLDGALAAYDDAVFLASVVARNAVQRDKLSALLARHGLTPRPSWTNFVLGDAGTPDRASAIVARLAELGVFIRKPGQPPLDRFVRVSVGLDEDLAVLDEALVASALQHG
jgi:histidinol-phosphate aminotransferase